MARQAKFAGAKLLFMQYWLMKTEPDTFSIQDLKQVKKSGWDGVRNYQARNFMRNEMKKGDLVLIYHSSCPKPGVAGIATISKESHPDPTCWDKKSKYYDPKSTQAEPRWFMVEVKWKQTFKQIIELKQLKKHFQLAELKLLQKGNRLSILPLKKEEYEFILSLAD